MNNNCALKLNDFKKFQGISRFIIKYEIKNLARKIKNLIILAFYILF